MTKVRPPISIENTLLRVLGELGIERAMEATGRAKAYLHAVTDPERGEQLMVRDMIALDLACREAGDPTHPLYETIGLMLDAANATRFACSAQLGRLAGDASREGGEACAAIIDVALGADRDPGALAHALRQAEEAHDAWTDAIAVLRGIAAPSQISPPDTS